MWSLLSRDIDSIEKRPIISVLLSIPTEKVADIFDKKKLLIFSLKACQEKYAILDLNKPSICLIVDHSS